MKIAKVSAFTLIEVLIVVAMIGLMAGLAVPTFRISVEKSRANEARAAINIIYSAEKIYYLNYNAYWPAAGTSQTAINTINSGLSTDLPALSYYGLSVSTGNPANTFTATATRSGGTKTFSINQTGTPSEGGSY